MFNDTFTEGSDTNLEDHTPDTGTGYTLISGSTGGIYARAASGTARPSAASAYEIDDQGSSDFYVEAIFNGTAASNNDCYVTMRMQDDDNFVALQITSSGSTGARLVVRIAGTDQTPKIETTATVGAVYRVEAVGNTWKLFVDSVQQGGDQTISNFSTETAIGLVAKGAGSNTWVTELTADAISSGATLTADSGTYTYTGSSVGLLTSKILQAGSGTYNYTGTDTNLISGALLTAESGAYNYTGTDASLDIIVTLASTFSLNAESGSYTYSGADINFNRDRVMIASSGAYIYQGTDIQIIVPSLVWTNKADVSTSWANQVSVTTIWTDK